MTFFKNLYSHWPDLLWAFLILIVSLIPGKNIPILPIIGLDKLVHFILFGILAHLFLIKSIREKQNIRKWNIFFWLIVFVCYGIILELIQDSFVKNRTADLFDGIANAIGVMSAYFYQIVKNK